VLTSKQEAFAQWVAAGKTPPEAYLLAYDTAGNMVTVEPESYRVFKHPAVAARIQQLRDQAHAIKLKQHLKDLEELRDAAKGDAQFSAAITAEVARGKASGLYIERKEVAMQQVPQLIIERPSET
jgi:hypothetical protein